MSAEEPVGAVVALTSLALLRRHEHRPTDPDVLAVVGALMEETSAAPTGVAWRAWIVVVEHLVSELALATGRTREDVWAEAAWSLGARQ